MIIQMFKKSPVGSPLLLGLTCCRTKEAFGHTIAWRSYHPNPDNSSIIYYEFIDPNYGLWRSNHESLMLEFVEDRLVTGRNSDFLPRVRSRETFMFRFIHIQDQSKWKGIRLSLRELLYPFKEEFEPIEDHVLVEKEEGHLNMKDEVKFRKLMEEDIPLPENKKKILLIIAMVTDKSWKHSIEFPNSNNKLAKMKYSEFRDLWGYFCRSASLPQLQKLIIEKK